MAKIAIASDPGGWDLKAELIEYYKNKGINLQDMGTYSNDSCDYPDMADKLCRAI